MMKNILFQKKYQLATYSNRGIDFVKGEGNFLIDSKGEKYLDLMTNYGVNILGYGNKKLEDSLKNQLGNLINLHSSFANEVRVEAMKSIFKFLPENMSKVYFSSTGTEAIEAAIKFASVVTGRKKFVSALNGYHGKTLGSLSATTSYGGKYQTEFDGMLLDFKFTEFGNIQDLENIISDEIAAVILEPIQGEGGIIPSPDGYLEEVEKLCKKFGTVLVIDEIQSGLGRTGTFLEIEKHKVSPDIICLGKGLGGGIPTAGTFVTKEIAENIPRGLHTTTMGGNPLSMAGIVATLEILSSENLIGNAKEMGEYFLAELSKIKTDHIKEVRGVGLMIGIEIDGDNMEILKQLQDRKIIAAPSGDNVIRFLPPLGIKREEIEFVLEELRSIFSNG